MKTTSDRTIDWHEKVTHPDRGDEVGTVVDDDRRPAWTPNELTHSAPDTDMVKVRWHDSVTDELYWEYLAELHRVH